MLALAGAVSAVIAAAPAGASADTTVSPTNLEFGTLPVGQQSVSQVVTLTQSCSPLDTNCVLGIVGESFSPVIGATSGFVPSSVCPPTLTALIVPQVCTIDVRFVPGLVGSITGLLSTGSGGPTVGLHGAGSAPQSANGVKRRTRKCKKHKKNRAVSSAKKKCKKKRK